MAISSTSRKAGPFTGNGTTTEFSFDFKVFDPTDVAVIRACALGVETKLVVGNDYAIALNEDQNEAPGGVVTLTAPLSTGCTLVLLSEVPMLQPVDITNQGGFYPDLLNDGLDRGVVQVQQLAEGLGRAIKLPVTADADDLTLPTPRGNQVLAWGPDGRSLLNLDPAELISVVTYGNTKADKFDGNGATTSFTLSASPGSVNNLMVSIDGVVQVPGIDYTWGGGTVLSFTVAPPAGTKVFVRYQEALDEGTDVSSKADRTGLNIDPVAEAPLFREAIAARAKPEYPVIKDLLAAAGDGVTDCSATLARTDIDFITLPPGDFRVTSNCTITRPLYFAPGAKMTIDAGVTVTFSGKGQVTSDCRRQIFYGTGAVVGLRLVDETWFVGDKIYSLTFDQVTHDVTTPLSALGPDADAEVQRAANAVRQNGKYLCHSGVLSLSGANLIAFNNQVEIVGDVRTSLYMWTTLQTEGFALNRSRSKVSGVWFRKYTMEEFATSGAALYVNSSQIIADNLMIYGAYIGIIQFNQAGGHYSEMSIYGSRNSAFALNNVNDTSISNFIFQGSGEVASFTSPSAGWSPIGGDILTGSTSGAKFTVYHQTAFGKVYLTRFYQNATGFPVPGETFTISRNGATATLSAYEMPHNDAGMKLYQNGFGVGNYTEGAFVANGDILGGRRALLILGEGVGYREGPSFNMFTNVFFDSTLETSVLLKYTDGVRLTNCWIASKNVGLQSEDARNISLVSCEVRDNDSYGAVIQGTFAGHHDFISCAVTDNRIGIAGTTGAQVQVAANFQATLNIEGGKFGKSVSTRHSTDTAIEFLGTAAKFTAKGTNFGGTRFFPLGNIFGLPQYWVQGCSAARMKSRGSAVILAGGNSVVVTHGLSFTPAASLVRLQPNSGNGYGGGASFSVSAVDATSITITLYDPDGDVFVATKNVGVLWEIDQSYNAIS